LFYACSASSTYKLRSFIFDGVPDPNENLVTELDSLNTVTDSLDIANVVPVKPEMYVHPPYENRGCSNCHDKRDMAKPKLPVPDLCFECHEAPSSEHSFLHGPVDSGNCTTCHNPHRSKIEKLLRHEGNDLCLNCHEEALVLKNPIHSKIEDNNCTQCHNPHGGNDRFVLQKDACFSCHESSLVDKKFVHGPVASGQCNLCHDNHESTANKLLLTQGDALCLNCHNTKDLYQGEIHKSTTDQTCISCHNPHASNAPYLTHKLETP